MAIGDENVQPAIVVVIERCDTRTWSLEDGALFGGAGSMTEYVGARLPGNVKEKDRSLANISTINDGLGVSILDSVVRRAVDTPIMEE